MLKLSDLESFKVFAELQVNQIAGGAMYLITEGNTITWKLASEKFDIKEMVPGTKIHKNSAEEQCMEQGRIVTLKVPRADYGVRLSVTAAPICDEDGQVVGTTSIVIPKLHSTVVGFPHFAPIISEMFPEGVFLYISDLEKVIDRQPSEKFDMPSVKVGGALGSNSTGLIAMRTKKLALQTDDGALYGFPIAVMSYPIFDEEDNDTVVGSFGIILPKKAAKKIRDVSTNLNEGLESISSAIQQLAAASSQIHASEQELSSDIKNIYDLSEEIDKISLFISDISRQTKMLGLNASIEASRAGEVGRGFSIVAKEIRRLSEQSNSTVTQIKELTENIKTAVDATNKKSDVTLASSQEQAAATQEITASVEELTALSQNLNDIAKDL